MSIFNLSETETEIMEFFWDRNDVFTFYEVYQYFIEEKNKEWKKQTLYTYFSRLINKGVLTYKKKGTTYLYYSKIDKKKYIKQCTNKFLDDTFGGSLKNFLCALSGDDCLDPEAINELKEYFIKND